MRCLAVFVMLAAMLSISAAKDELQVADLVKKHLNSIGTEPARAAVKNRVTEGTLRFERTDGAGGQDGKQVMVSEGNKLICLLKLPNSRYHGERFVSNGKKAFVENAGVGVYSELGQLIGAHDEILTEGLWGGTLSTAWPLAHLDERHAKLEDHGLKNVDGRDLRQVDYIPKKRSDLQVELYFDPDTLRHVMTVYLLNTPGILQNYNGSRYRIEERFADFKSVDNLTLPQRWTIRFSVASVSKFEITETNISHNVQLDPKNFEVK